jgi:hypothetical protein
MAGSHNATTPYHTITLEGVGTRDRGDTKERHSDGKYKLLDTGYERSTSGNETQTTTGTAGKETRRPLQEDPLEHSQWRPRGIRGTMGM